MAEYRNWFEATLAGRCGLVSGTGRNLGGQWDPATSPARPSRGANLAPVNGQNCLGSFWGTAIRTKLQTDLCYLCFTILIGKKISIFPVLLSVNRLNQTINFTTDVVAQCGGAERVQAEVELRCGTVGPRWPGGSGAVPRPGPTKASGQRSHNLSYFLFI